MKYDFFSSISSFGMLSATINDCLTLQKAGLTITFILIQLNREHQLTSIKRANLRSS